MTRRNVCVERKVFGTALDIALQELRIESFFPADEATRVVLIS